MLRVNHVIQDNHNIIVSQRSKDSRIEIVNHYKQETHAPLVSRRNGDYHTYQVNHATEYKHTPRVCQYKLENQSQEASQCGIDNHATPASHDKAGNHCN